MEAAIRKSGGVGAGVKALGNAGYARLRPILLPPARGVAAFMAAYHLGDPFQPTRLVALLAAHCGVGKR
jgi:hypothetical protein